MDKGIRDNALRTGLTEIMESLGAIEDHLKALGEIEDEGSYLRDAAEKCQELREIIWPVLVAYRKAYQDSAPVKIRGLGFSCDA